MAIENPLWGQERIADELLLKLGIRISPANGWQVHTKTRTGAAPWRSALVDVPAQPREGYPCLRLLHCCHCYFPDALRVRGDRARHPAAKPKFPLIFARVSGKS